MAVSGKDGSACNWDIRSMTDIFLPQWIFTGDISVFAMQQRYKTGDIWERNQKYRGLFDELSNKRSIKDLQYVGTPGISINVSSTSSSSVRISTGTKLLVDLSMFQHFEPTSGIIRTAGYVVSNELG
jgi:hypothetical protein